MPFWWARRKRPWYTSRRVRRYRRRWPKRRSRYYRRKYRPTTRRRRRRRRKYKKVRRKRQKITIKQWQPDSIVKCKIIGLQTLVAGAQGRQMFCYTNEKDSYTQPKAPGGGGFGCEVYNLSFLYQQWVAHKNIWTKSNDYKDLCRFLGAKLIFYPHRTTDFIVSYTRQPPFLIQKDTYTSFHPVNMLLSKHHKVIPSQERNPTGKRKYIIKIKPPKQMITKWFFQEQFATANLFQVQATAANFSWSPFAPNSQSELITFYALNTNFYQRHNWAQVHEGAWLPYLNYPVTKPPTYYYPTNKGEQTFQPGLDTYYSSVDYDHGFFCTKLLTATKVLDYQQHRLHELPVTVCRYNPNEDTGQGSAVWIVSNVSDNHWAKPTDKDLIIVGKPIWMALFGLWNYIIKAKKDKNYLLQAMFVVESPAIKLITATTQKVFPVIDKSFLLGKMPYDELLTQNDKLKWWPSAMKQQEILNTFVLTGPFIPNYAYLPNSSWNLNFKYIFYFKWGGPEITDQPVANPKDQGKYDVPDTVLERIQVSNPLRQTCKAMLRAWDYRRGIITKGALKRMSENIRSDTTFQSDEAETPKKKKKTTPELPHAEEKTEEMQNCLLSLFEESTCQDPENLQQLIQHQQQQQQHLKQNLIHLLLDLKRQQRMLQLQTGIE
nr:MAG: ORF1 [Torque teno midi virus]